MGAWSGGKSRAPAMAAAKAAMSPNTHRLMTRIARLRLIFDAALSTCGRWRVLTMVAMNRSWLPGERVVD
jgi:hypothetical protein